MTVQALKLRLAEPPDAAGVWCLLHEAFVDSIIAKGRSVYIRGIAMRPDMRGQRIGESLLSTIEEFARREEEATEYCRVNRVCISVSGWIRMRAMTQVAL